MMYNKRPVLLFFSVIVFVLTLYFFFPFLQKQFFGKKELTNQNNIAILKTATHPALDQAEQGFKIRVQSKFEADVLCVTKNADGSIFSADVIADSFVYDPNITLFYVIATPALQALSKKERSRPIIFSAVTNPDAVIDKTAKNVCGVTDFIDADAQLDLIIALFPSLRALAVPFNNAEINSIHAVARIKEACKKRDITVIEIGVLQVTDMIQALEQKITAVDLILTPTDNLVATSISLLVTVSKRYQIPLVVSDNTLLKSGAVASCGVDYGKLGEKAGELAYAVIQNQITPSEIGYVQSPLSPLFINKARFEEFKDILIFDSHSMIMVE